MRRPHIHERCPTALLNDARGCKAGPHIFGIDGRNAVRVASDSRLGHVRDAPAFVRLRVSGTIAKCKPDSLFRAALPPFSPASLLLGERPAGHPRHVAPGKREPRAGRRSAKRRRHERTARPVHQRQECPFADWQPDGSLLVATRFGDVDQIHRVTGPSARASSSRSIPSRSPAAAANANGFAFLKDRGGDENAQIYYYRNADRSTRMLTDGKSLNGNLVWAHDGKRLAFHSNVRDGVSYDIYVVDVNAGTALAWW